MEDNKLIKDVEEAVENAEIPEEELDNVTGGVRTKKIAPCDPAAKTLEKNLGRLC